MTVENQTRRTSATGTNAVGQTIPFSFPIGATSDLTVKTRITATGIEATLAETTNYTVTITGDTGGSVVMVTAVAATSEIHVIRTTPDTQSLDLAQGGTFNAENIEDALDKNTKNIIENSDELNRALVIPDTDSSSLDMTLPNSIDRAGYLFFVAGEPTIVAGTTPPAVTVSAFGEILINKADAAAVRALLVLVPGTDVQAYSAKLLAIAALAITDGNIIVGNGTTWIVESGATARTSLGAAADADVTKKDGSVAYTATGVGFRDEDDMLSNDATAPPSQQSVAAFLYSIVSYDGDVVTRDGEVVTYV